MPRRHRAFSSDFARPTPRQMEGVHKHSTPPLEGHCRSFRLLGLYYRARLKAVKAFVHPGGPVCDAPSPCVLSSDPTRSQPHRPPIGPETRLLRVSATPTSDSV